MGPRESPGHPQRRLRLVYATDNMRLGGTELNAVRTAERLDPARFEISVICLKDEGPLSARYREAGIPVQHLGLTSYSSPRSLMTLARVARDLRRARVDIVHCHDIYSNVFLGACGHASGARVVLSQRWARNLPPPRYRTLNELAYRGADLIVINSSSHARELAGLMPSVAARIVVLPGFADDQAFAHVSGEARRKLRRAFGLPEDGVLVGMVARLSPVKNHTTLLRAFAKVSAAHPTASLVLIGDGPTRPMLEEESVTLGIAERTHFLGERISTSNLHALFDISVLPSLTEGFPNSIVEAMAAGRPVVASAIDGIRDAVIDGETALLAPPTDAVAVACHLERLLSDPNLRRALGSRGRSMASQNYGAAAAMEQLEAAYSRLVSGEMRDSVVDRERFNPGRRE